MLRSPRQNHQEIIEVKNASLKPDKMNSAAKISQNNKKRIKKEEKNMKKKNKNKKKRSSLAFWFCMGNKTDAIDKDRQPFPAQKDKNKKEKENKKSSKENKKSSKSNNDEKKNSSVFSKNKDFEDKRRKRFSAPPTDWISMVATLEGHNEVNKDITSDANPNLDPCSEQQDEGNRRGRSKSPGGVRYRFDGTLEKPYVYPGGLTFLSMRQPKKNKGKRWSRKSSKKKGSKDSLVEAEIHHTDDEDALCYYDSDEHYDESDIRTQFYLRYDSHMKTKPSKKDRRYSMPAELQKKVEMETDVIGALYGRGGSRWVDDERAPNGGSCSDRVPANSDHRPDAEELYDEPYEGSDVEVSTGHLMAHSRPSSYYNSPPALQDSECVYMWHSCEDIPKCDVEYHSEQEIRSSRECVPQSPNDVVFDSCVRDSNNDNSNNNSHFRNSSAWNETIVGGRDNDECEKLPQHEAEFKNIEKEITQPSLTHPDNSHNLRGIVTEIPNLHPPYHKQHHRYPSMNTHDLSDDVFSNSIDNGSTIQSPPTVNLKEHFVKNTSKTFDNPFRRNLGRASCMPGNKRFFVPPPPTYTPPREEFEMALGKMAMAEKDEETRQQKAESGVKGRDHQHSRGSQTDLTDESLGDDLLDMVEREKRADCKNRSGEMEPAKQTYNDRVSISQNSSNISKDVAVFTQNNSKTDDQNKSTDSSLRNDAGDNLKSDHKTGSTSSLDSDEGEVHDYINCPKFEKPASLSPSTHTGQRSSRRHTVMTSTPKAKRKTELSTPVVKRTPKRPVPTPRQRFSSCLEYSTITLPSSHHPLPHQQSQPQQQQQQQQQPQQQHHHLHHHQQQQPQQLQRHHHQQQQPNIPDKAAFRNSVSFPMSSPPQTRPVAKKRLSQMLSSDSSYSHADIEEGLKIANDEYNSPSIPSNNTNNTAVRKALFLKDKNANGSPSISSSNPRKPISILEDPNEQDSKTHLGKCSNSGSDNSIPSTNTKRIPIILDTDTILPPLQQFKLERSPTASKRQFTNMFSSSVECLASPFAKSSYYSGLSSSLADLPSLFENIPPSSRGRRIMNTFPYDDDDNDDENADDEMSVHNEESPLPRTPSLEDLLRSRSILDRSQAVCRKRRQRLRERKCQSQILSSTEVDNYMKNEHAIRHRHSRHSSKKKDIVSKPKTDSSNLPNIKPKNTTAFSFDHEITASIPAQTRRFLYRQNRLLNHTDSGMDSDGASPLNSRDFHMPLREDNVSPNLYGVSPLHIAIEENISGETRVLDTVNNRKSWENRMHDRYRLKKSSSKEFLAHSSNSHHLDKHVTVSNGFETLV